MNTKKVLCLDFDGVIHSYKSGWQGVENIPDEPVDGAFEALADYVRHFRVVIFSSRSKSVAGIEAMQYWLLKHGLDHDVFDQIEFFNYKPPAFLTIDDRAITFRGKFARGIDLVKFESWVNDRSYRHEIEMILTGQKTDYETELRLKREEYEKIANEEYEKIRKKYQPDLDAANLLTDKAEKRKRKLYLSGKIGSEARVRYQELQKNLGKKWGADFQVLIDNHKYLLIEDLKNGWYSVMGTIDEVVAGLRTDLKGRKLYVKDHEGKINQILYGYDDNGWSRFEGVLYDEVVTCQD